MPSLSDPLLTAADVSRRFGHRAVLQAVSLTARTGDVVLLVGPNGAGKTTLLRVLAGLLRPSGGRVERRGTIGMVAHHSMLYEALTAGENLQFFARLHGSDGSRGTELLDRLGLTPWRDERVSAFSRGMVQRLAIARALLHDPAVVLLDEPLTGLDDASIRVVLEVLGGFQQRGRAIVVTSHQLAELVPLATRVGILAGGRLLTLEPRDGRDADAIKARYRALVAHG